MTETAADGEKEIHAAKNSEEDQELEDKWVVSIVFLLVLRP